VTFQIPIVDQVMIQGRLLEIVKRQKRNESYSIHEFVILNFTKSPVKFVGTALKHFSSTTGQHVVRRLYSTAAVQDIAISGSNSSSQQQEQWSLGPVLLCTSMGVLLFVIALWWWVVHSAPQQELIRRLYLTTQQQQQRAMNSPCTTPPQDAEQQHAVVSHSVLKRTESCSINSPLPPGSVPPDSAPPSGTMFPETPVGQCTFSSANAARPTFGEFRQQNWDGRICQTDGSDRANNIISSTDETGAGSPHSTGSTWRDATEDKGNSIESHDVTNSVDAPPPLVVYVPPVTPTSCRPVGIDDLPDPIRQENEFNQLSSSGYEYYHGMQCLHHVGGHNTMKAEGDQQSNYHQHVITQSSCIPPSDYSTTPTAAVYAPIQNYHFSSYSSLPAPAATTMTTSNSIDGRILHTHPTLLLSTILDHPHSMYFVSICDDGSVP
jgi:hypothetical protein